MVHHVAPMGASDLVRWRETLFHAYMDGFLHNYDASADGQRFLILTSTPQKLPSPITVVVNSTANLKK
jgi:hypothetical protein